MADDKPLSINFDHLGLKLSMPGDLVGEGAYTRLLNLTSFKRGYLHVRPGSSKVYETALSASVHSMGRMLIAGVGKTYEGAGTKLYRNGTEVASGFSGYPISFEAYQIGASTSPYMVAFDRTKRVKDSGTAVSNYGIATPAAAASAVAATASNKEIDTFESATGWTGSECTVELDTTEKKQGSGSIKATVPANTEATASKSLTLDLSKFILAGDSDDDDYLHFWLRVDYPDRLTEVRIMLDCDPTTNDFTKNYYFKAIEPSSIQRVVVGVDTSQQAEWQQITSGMYRDPNLIDDYGQQEYQPVPLVTGEGQWTEFLVKKSEFVRVGSHSNSWADIKAIGLRIKTGQTGTTIVNIDDGYMTGGASMKLDGNYDWVYIYRNSATEVPSPLSPFMASQATITKTGATVTIQNTTDAQVDKVDLYRRGGTKPNTYGFVKTVNNNPAGGTQDVSDGLSDGDLSTVLTDTQLAAMECPTTSRYMAIHAFRAWITDTNYPDRLWYSEPYKIESFNAFYYVPVSQGGEEVKRPYQLEDQLFALTNKTVYRIVGTAESSFIAISTGLERGLFSESAICRGKASIFFRAYDGIYAFTGSANQLYKLSDDIDPLFHGLTVEGRYPIDHTQAASERLEYWDDKIYYSYTDSIAIRREMILDIEAKRWEPTDRAPTSYLRLDDANQFRAGDSAGYVWLRETGLADGASAINFSFRTGYFDLGLPAHEKLWKELTIDADPDGATLSVKAVYDNGSSEATLGTITGTGRTTYTLPINNGQGTRARNFAIEITDNNESHACKFYKGHVSFMVEPIEALKYLSEWEYGPGNDPGRKIWRQVTIDCDGQGQAVIAKIYIDSMMAPVVSWAMAPNTGRYIEAVTIGEDKEGRLGRLLLEATGTTPFKYYNHLFDVIPQHCADATFYQTDFTDAGSPGYKWFNQVNFELDTNNGNVVVEAEFDDGTSQEFGCCSNYRTRITRSFAANTIKKLARLKFQTVQINTSAAAIDSGEHTVTPGSMTGIKVGSLLLIASTETVEVKAVTPTTFTAVFMNSYLFPTITRAGNNFLLYSDTPAFDVAPYGIDVTFLETPWSNDGSPDAKIYRTLYLRIGGTTGDPLNVTVEIDNLAVHTFTSVPIASVDKEVVLSLPFDTRGYQSRISITRPSGSVGTFTYSGHTWNTLPDSSGLTKMQTAWEDLGTPLEKYFRVICLEIDTGSQNVTVTVGVDGSDLPGTFTVNASTRKEEYLCLPFDTRGKLIRLKLQAATATVFRYYGHRFDTLTETHFVTKLQTAWENAGSPEDKFFRNLILDIDTANAGATVTAEVDHFSHSLGMVQGDGRYEFVLALPFDTRGELARLKIECATGFRYFGHKWDTAPDVSVRTKFQTDWSDCGTPLEKFFRVICLEIDTLGNPATVTVGIDNADLPGTFTVNTSGHKEEYLALPFDTRGRVARLKIECSTGFRYYGYKWDNLDETHFVKKLQTAWENLGGPDDKILRVLMLDIDTASVATTVTVEVDGVALAPMTVTNTGRREEFLCLPYDTRGKLVRLKLESVSGFRYHSHRWNALEDIGAITQIATAWDNTGTDLEKFFRTLVVDLDTLSAAATVTVEIDGVAQTPFPVTTTGRRETYLSLPFDTRGRLSRVKVACASGFRFYGHRWDNLKDTTAVTKYQTEWTDLGKPNPKIFLTMPLEIDTGGQNVTATLELDGATGGTWTVNTATRLKKILAFNKDTKGTVCRLKLESATATPFRYYGHTFDALDEPNAAIKYQTPWSLCGYPGDKRFRQLILEVDTVGADLTVNVEIDGVTAKTFTVNTPGHRQKVLSLNKDTIGKIARLTFSGATDFTYYTHSFDLVPDPLDVTFFDTFELDFGYDRWKFIRRFWIAAQGSAQVTMKVYVDEVLKTTQYFTSNPASGWARNPIVMPSNIKGQLFRFTFESASAFKLFLDQSRVEWHPLNGERGYQKASLVRVA